MVDINASKDELIDKSVVDAKGNLVGKCLDLVEGDDPYLIILVQTTEKEMKKSKVPLETIQAVGEMIMLNVEIEGVIKGEQIVGLNNASSETDDTSIEENESTGEEQEIQSDDEKSDENAEKDTWVLYKSIKS